MNITSAEHAPQHLSRLRQWYLAEWGRIDSFAGNHPGIAIPAPLLALETDNNSAQQLLGGLVFSTFGWPTDADVGVWINAVYVAPEHRGKQIASALITSAEQAAIAMEIETLFVYAQIPALYQKLGWQLVEQTGDDCVLTKVLGR